MSTGTRGTHATATLDDLARAEGNAELIAGRIVPMSPTGFWPGWIAGQIYLALHDHAAASGGGFALGDGVGFAVPRLTSGRESFAPDVSYCGGPRPGKRMKFVAGAPAFAVEVRSENDYGPAAEAEQAAKRADYFEAGTAVVWDVDPLAERVHAYRADTPGRPATFGRGQEADAEPAVPGWRLAVDRIFA